MNQSALAVFIGCCTLLLGSWAAFARQPKPEHTPLLSVHRGAQPPSADDIIASLKPNQSALSGPTRGIRPAIAAPTATTAAARPWVNLAANFRLGSAALTRSTRLKLDALGTSWCGRRRSIAHAA